MADTTDKAGAMVERFDLGWSEHGLGPGIMPRSSGTYVRFEAYAALQSRIAELESRCERLREIADTFLPVMEAARPLVLNLERLRDAATEAK